ncbi:MAG: hypothetical protein MJB57_10335 [Gemmatimonadetes bacterium]|nr:hypothetical protein [Gemmatimonadota bacterium]
MKSRIFSLALLVTATGAFSARSAEAQETVSMSAEVIDIACYVGMGMTGEGHRECAQACADQGLPLGFLGEDGHVYLGLGEGMPAANIKDQLKAHAHHQVTVEGAVAERSGARSIVVSKVSM